MNRRAEREVVLDAVKAVDGDLTHPERLVMVCRYGECPMTLAEIAERHSHTFSSRAHVRQVEASALAKAGNPHRWVQ